MPDSRLLEGGGDGPHLAGRAGDLGGDLLHDLEAGGEDSVIVGDQVGLSALPMHVAQARENAVRHRSSLHRVPAMPSVIFVTIIGVGPAFHDFGLRQHPTVRIKRT